MALWTYFVQINRPLTQDKVVLEYHLDIHGNEDDRVFRHAFLNSYFQTGLRNLMDVAILEYAQKYHEGESLKARYQKVDEIPFDFPDVVWVWLFVIEENTNGYERRNAVECKYVPLPNTKTWWNPWRKK